MTDAEKRTFEILKDANSFNKRGGELVTGNIFGDKLMTPEEEADATDKKVIQRKLRIEREKLKPEKVDTTPDYTNQVDMFESTYMSGKFLLFLESLTTDNNATLIESICEGFGVIFEATLAPIEYNNLFGNRGTFTTDKNNVIVVGLDIDDNIAEVMFSTNGKYSGEGHDDPQILRGVVYVVHDLVKKLNEDSHGIKIDTLTFYGTEEELKIDRTMSEIIEVLNGIDGNLEVLDELIESMEDEIDPTVVEVSHNFLRDISKFIREIKSGSVDIDNLHIKIRGYIEIVHSYIRYVYNGDNGFTPEIKSHIESITNNITKGIQSIIDTGEAIRKKYIKDRGESTKRSNAYKTLTRRYFPEIRIEEDGNNVTLHLPENGFNKDTPKLNEDITSSDESYTPTEMTI